MRADSGSWTDPFAAVASVQSPTVFELEIKTVETSALGTFAINFQGQLNILQSFTFSGTWISHGSDAYAGLSGRGIWSLTFDSATGIRTITCSGLVHFDP